jgi:hypothetical protein
LCPVDVEKAQHWNSRGHVLGAAAEAMRRILVDKVRRRKPHKQWGRLGKFEYRRDTGLPARGATGCGAKRKPIGWLVGGLIRHTQRFPKNLRCSYTLKLELAVFDFQQAILMANGANTTGIFHNPCDPNETGLRCRDIDDSDLEESNVSSVSGKANGSSKVKLFLLVIAVVGLLITAGGGYFASRSWQARSWPTVEGQITESEVERERAIGDTDEEVQYKAVVKYSFTVDGRPYTGERVAFGLGTSNRPSGARRIVDRYPAGRAVEIHYSPIDPSDAVLETNVGGFAIITLIVGPIILLAGAIGFIAEFRGKVSVILAQASDKEIGGDDGTTFGFETHET